MFKFFKRVKNSLSHVKEGSWHYKIAQFRFFGGYKPVNTKKACSYWWGRVTLGIFVLIFIAPIFYILAGVVYVLYKFFGYTPDLNNEGAWNEKYRRNDLCYKYKYSHRKKRYVRFAPWEVFGAVLMLAGVVYLAVFNQDLGLEVGKYALFVALGSLVLFVVFLVFFRGWRKYLKSRVSTLYNKVCPDLVIKRKR